MEVSYKWVSSRKSQKVSYRWGFLIVRVFYKWGVVYNVGEEVHYMGVHCLGGVRVPLGDCHLTTSVARGLLKIRGDKCGRSGTHETSGVTTPVG